eukprot:1137809-Pelagomonas_calceolata.AAC.3
MQECEYVPGCMPMGVGDGSIVRRAIIDKNARVGGRCQIINKEGVKESNQEGKGWVIKDGIVVIVKVRRQVVVALSWHRGHCQGVEWSLPCHGVMVIVKVRRQVCMSWEVGSGSGQLLTH